MQIYYENILANENYIAKPNVVWCADITNFELSKGKKIYAFFCRDKYNKSFVNLRNVLKSILRALSEAIKILEVEFRINYFNVYF